jgi:uncharacterized membrane protein YfbV (UPF0208 family)
MGIARRLIVAGVPALLLTSQTAHAQSLTPRLSIAPHAMQLPQRDLSWLGDTKSSMTGVRPQPETDSKSNDRGDLVKPNAGTTRGLGKNGS